MSTFISNFVLNFYFIFSKRNMKKEKRNTSNWGRQLYKTQLQVYINKERKKKKNLQNSNKYKSGKFPLYLRGIRFSFSEKTKSLLKKDFDIIPWSHLFFSSSFFFKGIIPHKIIIISSKIIVILSKLFIAIRNLLKKVKQIMIIKFTVHIFIIYL